jgi:hypothetical protein
MHPALPTSSSKSKLLARYYYHQVHTYARLRSFAQRFGRVAYLPHRQALLGLQHRWLVMGEQLQLDVLKESAIKGLASPPILPAFKADMGKDTVQSTLRNLSPATLVQVLERVVRAIPTPSRSHCGTCAKQCTCAQPYFYMGTCHCGSYRVSCGKCGAWHNGYLQPQQHKKPVQQATQ